MRKILVRGFISSRRRRWWAECPAEQLPDAGSADPQADIDERLLLEQALRRLPPRRRAVVILRYVEDLPERQVAKLLGCRHGEESGQQGARTPAQRPGAGGRHPGGG